MTERVAQDLQAWVAKIRNGEPQAISRAITAVENRGGQASELLKRLFPHTGRAKIVGITGASGSGKSTLVNSLTSALRKQGKTVGILAVDPSSPFSGGAILGDRIRMQAHQSDPGTYIRSMATRGSLGGLARATLDASLILDAAGKDYVLIETVGVGQDEVDVAKLADVTLVVLVPGLGDDIQAFKAGIMEIADIFVVNKSDLPGAGRVEQEILSLLSMAPHSSLPPGEEWSPRIVKTVATRDEGVTELLQVVGEHLEFSERQATRNQRQRAVWRTRLVEILHDRLMQRAMQNGLDENALDRYAATISTRAEDPYTVADRILDQSEEHRGNPAKALALDHLGVGVASLSDASRFYERSLGLKVSGYETISQEKTNVALIPVGGSRIELLEPTEPDSPIGRFLAKRGEGLHHICLRVPDLRATIERLRQEGVHLINPEPAVGAGGHLYVFVHPRSAGGVLLELVQAV